MRDGSRSHLVRVAVVIAGVLALAAAVYAFRARLAEAPLIGRLVAPRTAPAAASAPPDMPMASGTPTSTAEPPRGDVTIDTRRQQLIGVRVVPVEQGGISSSVRTTGVVRYDETRQTDVNVKVDGWIRDLYVDFTGQPVRRGERLFTLYSPELLATQNELLLALRNRDQAQASSLQDSRDYANRLVEASRQRLTLWDLSADDIRGIETSRQPLPAITVVAPAGGIVAEKQAIKGMHVTAGQTLYKIADLLAVWVEADVYEQDTSLVRLGGTATVTFDAYPGRRFQGRVVYIYPSVDPQTRTMKVRLQFANPGGFLKPGMFATVELRGVASQGLTVPADAVLDSGTQQTVFVAEGDGRFTPRRVKAGRRVGDRVEILDGLKEREQVATGAAFFLDSESQLRAAVQSYQAPPDQAATGSPGQRVDITFRAQPDPPRTGENTFEVAVRDASGQPISDADVSVTFFMPAMPTMNMPAMRNAAKLPSAGGGVYRGSGQVIMAGRWDVTVDVSRGGQRLGSGQFAVVAR